MNTLQKHGYNICNLTLTVSSIAAVVSAIWDHCGRRHSAMRLIELVVHNIRRKSSNVLTSVYSIFVRIFLDQSSGRKSFRFTQVLINIFLQNSTYSPSSFHCIIIYYAQSNSVK